MQLCSQVDMVTWVYLVSRICWKVQSLSRAGFRLADRLVDPVVEAGVRPGWAMVWRSSWWSESGCYECNAEAGGPRDTCFSLA